MTPNGSSSYRSDILYSSVAFVIPGAAYPPKPNPAVCVPADPNLLLAVVKTPPVAQDAVCTPKYFKEFEVLLNHTSPINGAGGSELTVCI